MVLSSTFFPLLAQFNGSTPTGEATPSPLSLSLDEAVARGLKTNLGLLTRENSSTSARVDRMRLLTALLRRLLNNKPISHPSVLRGSRISRFPPSLGLFTIRMRALTATSRCTTGGLSKPGDRGMRACAPLSSPRKTRRTWWSRPLPRHICRSLRARLASMPRARKWKRRRLSMSAPAISTTPGLRPRLTSFVPRWS
jgi:hypothetical protein